MSTNGALKGSPHRSRKHKQKDEIVMKQEIMAQVHKQLKSATSSDNVNSEDNLDVPKSDKNENYSSPSREISVDGETQINTKILSLIETEMKRDIKKHSHFTESRPQSLSFYEDEKIPEELSGNLELLSPEEKRHYRKRKEYGQMDVDERNAYNVIQELYNSRDQEELMNGTNRKSKSRKKKYGETENGIGDSREMMIPKEKKKSKKKRREVSPGSAGNSAKKKYKNKNSKEHQLKTDITSALEELQDDVFENTLEDSTNNKNEKIKKSPKKSEKFYVQKKSKFEEINRHNVVPLSRQTAQDLDSISNLDKRNNSRYPIDVATIFQKWWMRVSNLCHGLLGGLGLGHWLYIMCNLQTQDYAFLVHYAYYSDIYVEIFFALCVLCLISVFDRMDLGHVNTRDLSELTKNKKCLVVALTYAACLTLHLSTVTYDEKLSLLAYKNHSDIENMTGNHTLLNKEKESEAVENELTHSDLKTWNYLSLWRSVLAFSAWIIFGLSPHEDLLFSHLQNMKQYLPYG